MEAVRVAYPAPQRQSVLDALEELLPDTVALLREPDPIGGCEILIEGRPKEDLIASCPGLRHVVIPFAGVPFATAELIGAHPHLTLHNLHHNAPETAETALTLLLGAARDVVRMDRALRRHDWSPRYEQSRTLRLAGRTAVVLGYGAIGKRIARACSALGMEVSAVRRSHVGEPVGDGIATIWGPDSLDRVLPKAQALLIALPHTRDTDGLIGPERVAMLPGDAIVVNVARAQIVDERALFEALREGRIHSAGLDVWYRYPHADASAVPGYFKAPPSANNTPPSDFPFHELDNVVMSPHRGGTSRDTERFRIEALAELLTRAGAGEPLPNQVDPARGY